MLDISVVLPVYRNAETLSDLHQRLCTVLETLTPNFELIFVNDASPDASLSILEQLAQSDHRVVVLALEQNVGQHQAVLTGLTYALGEWTVILDADLQDPPEAIPSLLAEASAGFAAVFAGRRGNYEHGTRLATSRLFKSALHLLTGVPADAGMFLIMNHAMRARLLEMNVSAPFIVAMVGCAGLPITSIPVLRSPRTVGESSYTSWKRWRSAARAFRWVWNWRWQQLRTRLDRGAFQAPPKPSAVRIAQFIGERFENQS